MGRRNRFVKPETINIEISDGDTIEIKKELTVGEQKQMFTHAIKRMGGVMGEGRGEWDMDPVLLGFAKVEAYLIGWSFAEDVLDNDGKPVMENNKPVTKPVDFSPEAIQSIDETTYSEIEEAIDKHTEKLAEEKKASGGKRKSAKT